MATKYIKFKKYLVRNDLGSVLMFYNYILFAPDLSSQFLKKLMGWSDSFARFFFRLMFMLRLNRLMPQESSKKDFVVYIKKMGRFPTATNIFLKNNQTNTLTIVKEYPCEDILEKELAFAATYKNAKGVIRIPQFRKINKLQTEIEFLKARSLAVLVRLGKITASQLVPLYREFASALDELYRDYPSNSCLIHGDLDPANVYKIGDKFFLIDFTDTHVYEKNFDKFYFLKRLLQYHYGRDRDDILAKFFCREDIKKYNLYKLQLRKKKFHE